MLSAQITRPISPAEITIPRCAQAAESRDALAKTLYSNLFDWLVAAINRKIPSYGASACSRRGVSVPRADYCSVQPIYVCP